VAPEPVTQLDGNLVIQLFSGSLACSELSTNTRGECAANDLECHMGAFDAVPHNIPLPTSVASTHLSPAGQERLQSTTQ
jgi:hypothetical protein